MPSAKFTYAALPWPEYKGIRPPPKTMGRFQPKAHFLDVHLANGHHHHHHTSSSSTSTATSTITTTTTTSAPIYSSYFAGAIKPQIPHLRLSPPREEPTRVQLQKQRLSEQQHAKQLVSTTIPGYKTSAGMYLHARVAFSLFPSFYADGWLFRDKDVENIISHLFARSLIKSSMRKEILGVTSAS